jgi:hypothetical protein
VAVPPRIPGSRSDRPGENGPQSRRSGRQKSKGAEQATAAGLAEGLVGAVGVDVDLRVLVLAADLVQLEAELGELGVRLLDAAEADGRAVLARAPGVEPCLQLVEAGSVGMDPDGLVCLGGGESLGKVRLELFHVRANPDPRATELVRHRDASSPAVPAGAAAVESLDADSPIATRPPCGFAASPRRRPGSSRGTAQTRRNRNR